MATMTSAPAAMMAATLTFRKLSALRSDRLAGLFHCRFCKTSTMRVLTRKTSSGFSALMALCAFSQAANAAPKVPAANDLLRAMSQAEQKAEFYGVMVTNRRGEPGETVRIWRDGAKRRLEWLSPPVRRGDVLVDDGQNVWLYHRNENAAVQTKSLRRERMSFSGEAKTVGSGQVAGRRAWIVELGRRDGRNKRRIWIDAATKVRLRAERVDEKGRVEATALQSVDFGSVEKSRFSWSAPAGTKVTRTSGRLFVSLPGAKKAAGWLQYPRVLPTGFSFESAVVDGEKGEAWLRYTDGARRFSIFQQRARHASTQNSAPRAVDGAWYRQSAGSRLLGVGLPGDTAQTVMRSVR
jgi:negative regulator of sigma E activity